MTRNLKPSQHDFRNYLTSFTTELNAVKDRVRSLVKHWPSDGHFREAAFRHLLRRHVPETVLVGTGFVVNSFGASSEIDVLIVDRAMPTLFKEGELLIVTPESVKAIIEVKSRLEDKKKITDASLKLAEQKAHAQRHVNSNEVWAGLFVYDNEKPCDKNILNAAGASSIHSKINAFAFGSNTFVKYFHIPEEKGGPAPSNAWHSFHDPDLAPVSFLGSLLEFLAPSGRDFGTFAWFSRFDGLTKNFYLKCEPKAKVCRFPPS